MNDVRIKKDALLKIIKKNRAEHRGIFLEAQKKYREVVIERLDDTLKKAREGRPYVLKEALLLQEPQDYTSEYDRAVRMLELEVDKVVTLDRSQFDCLVRDVWGWSRNWALSNSSYVDSAKVQSFL